MSYKVNTKLREKIKKLSRYSISVKKTNRYIYSYVYKPDYSLAYSTSTASLDSGDTAMSKKNNHWSTKLAQEVISKIQEKGLSSENFVFNRNGYKYHGVVKTFCEELRKNNLVN